MTTTAPRKLSDLPSLSAYKKEHEGFMSEPNRPIDADMIRQHAEELLAEAEQPVPVLTQLLWRLEEHLNSPDPHVSLRAADILVHFMSMQPEVIDKLGDATILNDDRLD